MKGITAQEAIGTAIEMLELDSSARCTRVELVDGMYEIELRTLMLRYEVYVDAASAELVGVNYEPDLDDEAAYEESSILVA